MLIKDNIHTVIMSFGKTMGCHQRPERSFFIGKYQLPVCARCTGVLIGYILGLLMLIVTVVPTVVDILLMSVMFIDWYLQHEKILMSTNKRRLLTGILCGFGYIHLWANILCIIFNMITSN